eukprot:CAMPEP_0183721136 /NCGR_PEP_ID=MMETSP0737-20130205/13525_1 /TAXON_ID=385413 /ORGANISM="Thalassiosira miniscula, Strain CCMP1093" /LENGTH=547 /DNA_ID=CAMNT_0025951107 /DNA_START=55 /DNA_END=1695 /DNA_ORIENTATION=-
MIFPNPSENAGNQSHATEIAVDAHATRLLLQHSPPEACVDSSLGPYVASVLRDNLRMPPGTASSDASRDLIELLESHCQISPEVAQEVLSSISLAVQTGDVPGKGATNGIGGDTDMPSTRSRSKSLGAEPASAYDVEFLGKLLRDTMATNIQDPLRPRPMNTMTMTGSLLSSSAPTTDNYFFSLGNALPTPVADGAINQCVPIPKRERFKQRSVTFDETVSSQHYDSSQFGTSCPAVVSPMISLMPSPLNRVISEEDSPLFEPLGGILDILDMEGEDEEKKQPTDSVPNKGTDREKENEMEALQKESNGNNLPPRLELKGKVGNRASTTNIGRNSKKIQKSEANDLAAALFRPSRPRSNSMPISTSSYNNAPIPSRNDNHIDNATSKNAAELNATVQLLLTLNSSLGREAATLASQMTDGDLNLAQYLIEAARSYSSSGIRRTGSQDQQRRSRICRHELRGMCYRYDCPYSHDLNSVTCLFWLKGRCREKKCRFLHGFADSLREGICEEYLAEQKVKREEKEQKQHQMEEEEKKKIRTTNLLDHNQW